MLMSTDVASIMLPVPRGLMDRDRELDAMAGVLPNPGGAPAAVRGMKRGDPEPDGQTAAAALVDASGAECKRPRIDGSGGIGEVGQVRKELLCPNLLVQAGIRELKKKNQQPLVQRLRNDVFAVCLCRSVVLQPQLQQTGPQRAQSTHSPAGHTNTCRTRCWFGQNRVVCVQREVLFTRGLSSKGN